MAFNGKRRLKQSNALISMLEPGGGFQPSQVKTGISRRLSGQNVTDEEACPEEAISKGTVYNNEATVITPQMLEAIAATDEVSDVLERISSYIAVTPTVGTSFAYMDFVEDFRLPIAQHEATIDDMQRHWQIAQDMLFSKAASLSRGIQNFIIRWLTLGTLYIAIVRKKQKGIVIDIHVQEEPLSKRTDRYNNEYWVTDCDQLIWEKDDIFVLSFSELNRYATSFTASVMRSYNLFRSVERTRVANAIMSAQFRSVYTVPTAGLGKVKARQKLSSVMSLYKRDIRIDDATGNITVNGENTYPVNTELWVAETSQGAVKIDNPGDGNVNLNNMDMPQYFMRKFYKRAKLPMSKYEAVDSGYLSGLSEIDEDERQFKRFITDCQSVLAKVFTGLTFRLMSGLKQYVGRDDIKQNMTMNWYAEPKHETPSEELDGENEKLSKVKDLLDNYKDTLEAAGFNERQQTARINVLRIKLMRKYCPELLEQTLEDYRNVPEEESTNDDSDDWGNDDYGDSDATGSDDDFGDWSDDDFNSNFDSNDDWDGNWSDDSDFSDESDWSSDEW